MSQLQILWTCETCGSQAAVEDRGSYVKKLEIHPRLDELSREELQKVRACRHPRRLDASGQYYCGRCGRGPLKEPYDVNGKILGSCCKDKVSVQETVAQTPSHNKIAKKGGL